MPKDADTQPLAELFRANVLKLLKRKGLIDDRLIGNLMKWRHTSGFSVHNGVRLARDDSKGQTAVAQYILRNPFAQEKITFNETTSMVVSLKMPHSKGEGGKKNFAVYPACDFIAAITQHIPEKRCQMVRYFGVSLRSLTWLVFKRDAGGEAKTGRRIDGSKRGCVEGR